MKPLTLMEGASARPLRVRVAVVQTGNHVLVDVIVEREGKVVHTSAVDSG